MAVREVQSRFGYGLLLDIHGIARAEQHDHSFFYVC